MSASSTSCIMFPSSSIHPIALSTQSSVFISSMAEDLISSREGQDASQLLKSEFLEGFLVFLEGFLFPLDFLDFLDFFLEFLGLDLELNFFSFLSEGSSKVKALPELRSLILDAIDGSCISCISCISSMVAAIISGGTHCFRAASIFSCSFVPIPHIMCT